MCLGFLEYSTEGGALRCYQLSVWLNFSHSISSLLCFGALHFQYFPIFILLSYLLLLLCTAAGRKPLHANCVHFVRHGHRQLAPHCRRRSTKIGWGKAVHIFTVVIRHNEQTYYCSFMSASSCCQFQQVQVTDKHNKQGYEKQSMYLYVHMCASLHAHVPFSMCLAHTYSTISYYYLLYAIKLSQEKFIDIFD